MLVVKDECDNLHCWVKVLFILPLSKGVMLKSSARWVCVVFSSFKLLNAAEVLSTDVALRHA